MMPPSRPAPSFALSRTPTGDDDALAAWQAHVDAGRIGAWEDRSAARAAADAWERAVLGPRSGRRRRI